MSLSDGVVGIGRFSVGSSHPFTGIVVGDAVVRAADVPGDGASSLEDLLGEWNEYWPALRRRVDTLIASPDHLASLSHELDELRTLPPVIHPQIFQAGANYRKHVVDLVASQRALEEPNTSVEEIARQTGHDLDARARNGRPYLFSGLPSALCGAYDDVILPTYSEEADWEIELGVFFGTAGRNIPPEDANRLIAGYTIANDLTLRDLVRRADAPSLGPDWLRSKNPPTFLPLGPVIVPREYVTTPMDLRITLTLNGLAMQDESTSDMLFGIEQLVAYASTLVQILPGDILLTGSPAGNGAPKGRFLREGDVMVASISGLGLQRNRCTNT